jgi:rhamnosyltransferase
VQFAICIPTLNAGSTWPSLSAGLRLQSAKPTHVIVLDSESDDGTTGLIAAEDFQIISIPRQAFRHGVTRQLGAEFAKNVDVVVYLTQDAIPVDGDAIAALLRSFEDPSVGAAYGRQLPREGAKPIETHARIFNYPAESEVRGEQSICDMGLKSAFFSNSFGAYRRTALDAVGGFPGDVNFGEDTIVAAKMLLAGWKIAYVSEAKVRHSHNYSVREEFKRYVSIGDLHASQGWLVQSFGSASGEGLRFVKSELKYLLRTRPTLVPNAIVRTLSKYLGYQYGRLRSFRLNPDPNKRRLQAARQSSSIKPRT